VRDLRPLLYISHHQWAGEVIEAVSRIEKCAETLAIGEGGESVEKNLVREGRKGFGLLLRRLSNLSRDVIRYRETRKIMARKEENTCGM